MRHLPACRCVFQKADEEGILGVTLNKDIVKVAAKALEQNLTRLGPKVLPLTEKAIFAYDFVARKLGWRSGKPYVPKFRKAFDHFCLHAGNLLFPNPFIAASNAWLVIPSYVKHMHGLWMTVIRKEQKDRT